MSAEGLVSKIIKELAKLNSKKPRDPVRKWAKDIPLKKIHR